MSENWLFPLCSSFPIRYEEKWGKMPPSRFDESMNQSCLVALTSYKVATCGVIFIYIFKLVEMFVEECS